MNILLVASECAPFIRTGGLADVIDSVLKALAATGLSVKVMIPAYTVLARPPCISAHDSSIVRGFEIGRNIDWWRNLGSADESECGNAHSQRHKNTGDLVQQSADEDFVTAVHTQLAQSPAAMVTDEIQNLPGKTNEHLNWCRKYEVPFEMLQNERKFRACSDLMRHDRGKSHENHTMEMEHDKGNGA